MRLAASTLCLVSLVVHADAVLVDRIVAVVDAKPITRSAVEERARTIEILSRGAVSRDVARKDALGELIDELLVAREAERLQLTVDDAEIDVALQQLATQNQISLAQLTDEVRKQGLSLPAYRVMLRRKLLQLHWVSLKMNHAGLPAGADPGQYALEERNRLVEALRQAAAIEVRP